MSINGSNESKINIITYNMMYTKLHRILNDEIFNDINDNYDIDTNNINNNVLNNKNNNTKIICEDNTKNNILNMGDENINANTICINKIINIKNKKKICSKQTNQN